MQLVKANVGPYKSIEKETETSIDPHVTVLVGMNEAGKTAFLESLHKCDSAEEDEAFNPMMDYPRRHWPTYAKRAQETGDEKVVTLTYQLDEDEVKSVNSQFYTDLKAPFQFSITHKYDNTRSITLHVDETSAVKHLVSNGGLSSDAKKIVGSAKSLKEFSKLLGDLPERTPTDEEALTKVNERIKAASTNGWNVVDNEIWRIYISPKIPKFMYFDDYRLLPGKINLQDLQARIEQAKAKPEVLENKHRAVLALLRMAGIDLASLTQPSGYEEIKAKLEAISNVITEQVFSFWKQNDSLEVQFDIRPDPNDQHPFNTGPNLYIRIWNSRHRMTVPFDQRSRGFIWFFSFLVWFHSIQDQTVKKLRVPLILLLDEPGLSLHALAQADFLAYIDDLAQRHQVLYTTHSPFMIHSNRLSQVRIVEDKPAVGTIVSENLSGSNPKTLFPLQAALGYTIAQNLFINRKNLLVEGPADLIYLKHFSTLLETDDQDHLRTDVTVVPTGGLDKVATFVALLGGNDLEFGVLYDYSGKPDRHIEQLVREKLLPAKVAISYAQFRVAAKPGSPSTAWPATDVEDMFDPDAYLAIFNHAYADKLGGRKITVGELPTGDRIVDRLNRFLDSQGILLRPSGGFNHYLVASTLVSNPKLGKEKGAIQRFAALFKHINKLYTPADETVEA